MMDGRPSAMDMWAKKKDAVEALIPKEASAFNRYDFYEMIIALKSAKEIKLSLTGESSDYQKFTVTLDDNAVYQTERSGYKSSSEAVLKLVEFIDMLAPIDAKVIRMTSLRRLPWYREEDVPDDQPLPSSNTEPSI